MLQFKEESYEANLLDKFTLGSSLKGTLYYIDAATNTVIHPDKYDLAKSYKDMLTAFHISISRKFLDHRQATGDYHEGDVNEINANMKGFDPIKPEYKDLLMKS